MDPLAPTVPPPSRSDADGLGLGEVVANRFLIEEYLGGGGMGRVFRARDQVLGRAVAVKVLRPEVRANLGFVERFVNEARIVAQLSSNPHIITIYDVGTTSRGDPYIIMEFLRGSTLRESAHDSARMLPARTWVVDVGMHIASALIDAHAQGVAHRDLKPDNVFILKMRTQAFLTKVLDFGLARSATVRLSPEHATIPGQIMGTPQYMSPEMIRGEEPGAAADVYALGVMLYELAAGQPPYRASTLGQWLRAHELDPPRPLPQGQRPYPERFARLLERMLAKGPAERPTALDVLQELATVDELIQEEKRYTP